MRPTGFEKAGNEDKICAILEELKARIAADAREEELGAEKRPAIVAGDKRLV